MWGAAFPTAGSPDSWPSSPHPLPSSSLPRAHLDTSLHCCPAQGCRDQRIPGATPRRWASEGENVLLGVRSSSPRPRCWVQESPLGTRPLSKRCCSELICDTANKELTVPTPHSSGLPPCTQPLWPAPETHLCDHSPPAPSGSLPPSCPMTPPLPTLLVGQSTGSG